MKFILKQNTMCPKIVHNDGEIESITNISNSISEKIYTYLSELTFA